MIFWQILNGMLGLNIPAETLFWTYDILLIFVGLTFLILYLFAWDIIIVWLRAWWQKKPILLEWTKAKQWKFKIPELNKAVPDVLKLDDGKRIVQLRRESVGLGPHKIPLVLMAAEFPATISPTEIEGDRYYTPETHFWGVPFNNEVIKSTPLEPEEEKRLQEIRNNLNKEKFMKEYPDYTTQIEQELYELEAKVNRWNNRQLYVRYPEHTTNVSEFVSFQKISVSPELISSYAEDQVIEAKNDYHNPWSMVNMQILIPLVMVIAIAYYIISQQNIAAGGYDAAMQSAQAYQALLERCGDVAIENATILSNGPKIGGAIQ